MDARFIVKASRRDGTHERWITGPRFKGLRAFGPRNLAASFVSWDGADDAIRDIQKSEDCSDVAFEVQSVEPTAELESSGSV
jgi:hypothetical protein